MTKAFADPLDSSTLGASVVDVHGSAALALTAAGPRAHPVPDRDTRVRAILDAIPPLDTAAGVPGFDDAIRSLLDGAWRRSIESRVLRAAPALASSPFYATKLRAGFSVYCALGIAVMACSTTRPAWLRFITAVARRLSLSSGAVAAVSSRLLPLAYRVLLSRELDLIAAASALILVLDDIFDDELGARSPEERVAAVAAVVEGRGHPSDCGAVAAVLVADLRASDPERWRAMAASLVEWARAELKLESGAGTSRKPGIEQSMALLAFGAPAFVGQRELQWMESIALIGQMVDDVVDLEKDLAAGRTTPAATGDWDVDGIGALYASIVSETRALVVAAGERHPPTIALYEATVRSQLRYMAEVLVAHP